MAPQDENRPAPPGAARPVRRQLSSAEIARAMETIGTSPALFDAYGNVWNGPGNPPPPTAAPGEQPRQWDYPVAWNVYRNPATAKTTDGGIDFSILRVFANQTLVRLAIETCKDLDTQVDYAFTVKAQPGEKLSETRQRAQGDPRLKQVAEFFESPDGIHDFSEWRRMAWEEILVCDNLSVYRWEFAYGKGRPPYALRLIDGDTIEPMIDAAGYEPQDGPAYEQWIKGVPRTAFTAQQILYSRFNPRVKNVFGLSPVEQLLQYIQILVRRDLKKLAEYTDGNIPAGLWSAPDDWQPKQIREAQVWLDTYLSGDPAQRAKLIFVPGGSRMPVFPGNREQSDPFDELLTRLVCYAFSVSVSSLVHQMNRATAQQNNDQADEEGAAIRRRKMARYLTRVVRWAFGWNDIVVTTTQNVEIDPTKQADIDFKNLQTGIVQPNEIRERDGRDPIQALVGKDGYYDPKNGFMLFDTAVNPPQPMLPPAGGAPFGNQPPQGNGKDDTQRQSKPQAGDQNKPKIEAGNEDGEANKVAVPTDDGKFVMLDRHALLKTQRGLVKAEDLRPGDEIVALSKSLRQNSDEVMAGGGAVKKKNLIVARHGETTFNVENRLHGLSNDVELTDNGTAEAHTLASKLSGVGIDGIITSNLKRAADTAQIVSKDTGIPILAASPQFATWDIGEFAGQDAAAAWDALKPYVRSPQSVPQGGESFNAFKTRVLEGVKQIGLQYPDKKVALVTHRLVDRVIGSWFSGGAPDDLSINAADITDRPMMHNGGIHRYAIADAGAVKVEKFNPNHDEKGRFTTGSEYYGRLADRLERDGGFSVHAGSMKAPKTGYMVSLEGHEQATPKKDFTAEVIRQYAGVHKQPLSHRQNFLGGWYNSDDGRVYLDVSTLYHSRSAALHAGRSRHQHAIFDLGRGESIHIGAHKVAKAAGKSPWHFVMLDPTDPEASYKAVMQMISDADAN